MAKKKTTKNTPETEVNVCRQCVYSYGWKDKGADGRFIVGYCSYCKDGKYGFILDQKACERFEKRK